SGTIGVVTLNPGGHSVTYNPNGQFEHLAFGEIATDSFTYSVADACGSSTATVTITIHGQNDAPMANAISTDANEDGPAGVLQASYSDVDTSDAHTFTINTAGTIGSVANNGSGTFTYNPNGQFESLAIGETATDTFAYTVNDGH